MNTRDEFVTLGGLEVPQIEKKLRERERERERETDAPNVTLNTREQPVRNDSELNLTRLCHISDAKNSVISLEMLTPCVTQTLRGNRCRVTTNHAVSQRQNPGNNDYQVRFTHSLTHSLTHKPKVITSVRFLVFMISRSVCNV